MRKAQKDREKKHDPKMTQTIRMNKNVWKRFRGATMLVGYDEHEVLYSLMKKYIEDTAKKLLKSGVS